MLVQEILKPILCGCNPYRILGGKGGCQLFTVIPFWCIYKITLLQSAFIKYNDCIIHFHDILRIQSHQKKPQYVWNQGFKN